MSAMKWVGPYSVSHGSPCVCMVVKRQESERKDRQDGNPNEGLMTGFHSLELVERLIFMAELAHFGFMAMLCG